MFNELKQQVRNKFEELVANDAILFHVEVDREKIWELYLNGFADPVERQSHNCNCCKSFLRQYSGLVTIVNNKMQSIWDIEVDAKFAPSINAIREYIHSLPITNRFFSEFAKLGTDKNKDGEIIWTHLYVELPARFVQRRGTSIESVQGTHRDNKNVLMRSLEELTLDACETVIELIAQNSLYRGKEFEVLVAAFYAIKKQYDTLPAEERENFCWLASANISQSVSRIRNTSIGTLLVDLSKGDDLDKAVRAFERVVAPTNYKRPNSLITNSMIEAAQKRIDELGLTTALNRRYATSDDISINDVLFVDRSNELNSIFSELQKNVLVNPKTLSKVEEISISDFINKVLPTIKSMEVLTENRHMSNFVTLVTASDPDAANLFKWNNPFSWSYTGGITDSLKERVKAAGGNVEGVLRFSIQWNENGSDYCDLDAHAIEPDLHRIYFPVKGHRSKMSGMLDVDMIRPRGVGIENITWNDEAQMREGKYEFLINNYDGGRNSGFKCQVEFNGEIHDFGSNRYLTGTVKIATVVYSKKSGFSIEPHMESSSNISSKEKWNVSTNQFTKAKKMMLSPNYWNGQVGNKHFLFMLEDCVSDEKARPFFNEFLKEELTQDRKVFEVVASKLKVDGEPKLCGLGFSETQRNSLLVRVEGNFKRTLKINF